MMTNDAKELLLDAYCELRVQGSVPLHGWRNVRTGEVCAVGMIGKVGGVPVDDIFSGTISAARDCAGREAWKALDKAAQELYGLLTITVNDEEGYEAVLRVYDHALAAA